jgi:hypothetical protein
MIQDSKRPSNFSGTEEREGRVPLSETGTSLPNSESDEDRRRANRYRLIHLVWFKIIEKDASENRTSLDGICKIADISETGMGLYSAVPVPEKKMAFFEIVTKDFSISCVGEIVYARKADDRYYRIGVRFAVVPPNDRLLLSEYFGRERKR